MLLYILGIALFGVCFYFWYKAIRVPSNLQGLPVVPGMFAKPSERTRVSLELAKTQPFARTWMFKWCLLVLHPEYAKQVETNSTVFDKSTTRFPRWTFMSKFFGTLNVGAAQTEDWKRHRSVINPAFEFAYIRAFTTLFAEVADKLIAQWQKFDPETPVAVHDWMQRFALDCLGKAAFGYDFECVKDPNSEYAQTYHRITDNTPTNPGIFWRPRLLSFGLYDLLPLRRNRELANEISKWNGLVEKMAKHGESCGDSDLITHLLKANAPGAANYLTKEEVRSNISIFFLAGHETSATSVAATLWYLARYPEVQQKAYDEIIRVCGKDDITFEAQKELEYLTRVIYEVNRLVTIVKNLPARVVMQDTDLGPIKLHKGDLVGISIEALHMLDREWSNPSKFDPDRFEPDKQHHPFAWQPFGSGPRACLGRNFSILEQRIVLAKILRAFKVCLPEGSPDHIQLPDRFGMIRVASEITLHPRT